MIIFWQYVISNYSFFPPLLFTWCQIVVSFVWVSFPRMFGRIFLCFSAWLTVWRPSLGFVFFFFTFSLETTSQSVTNDAANAHCTGWQVSVAAKPSITKKILFEMLSTVGTSKNERVKVTEGVWAQPGTTVQVTGIPGQAGRRERPLTHLTCIWSGLKKPFTWEEKLLKIVKKSSCLHLE